MRYRCLLFDFDGTLANTLAQARLVFNELAPAFRLPEVAEDAMEDLREMSTRQLIRHLGIRKRDVPRLLLQGKRLLGSRLQEIDLVEGIREPVSRLREKVQLMGILTSNSVENVEEFLRLKDFDLFDFVSSVPKLSGKAKHIKSISRTFSLHRAEIMYIGDEIRDMKASRKAGISVTGVTWGFNSRSALAAHSPDYLLSDPAELQVLGEHLLLPPNA